MTPGNEILAFLGELLIYAVLGLGLGLSLVIGARTLREFRVLEVIGRWWDECRAMRAKQEASNGR